MVCKHFLSRFLSSTAHVNTPTHLSITSTDFLYVTLKAQPSLLSLLPMITEVTFSKYFLSCRGKCWRSEWSVLFLMAKQSRTSLWSLFLKLMQVKMAFWNLVPANTSIPCVTEAPTLCVSKDLMFKWINQLCLSTCILKYLSIYSKEQMIWGAIFKSGYSFLSLS